MGRGVWRVRGRKIDVGGGFGEEGWGFFESIGCELSFYRFCFLELGVFFFYFVWN